MGVTPQQFQEMQARVKSVAPLVAPLFAPPVYTPAPAGWLPFLVRLDQYACHTFEYRGAPVGKPRMTQRDKFIKRPCVLRYRAFADGLRAVCGAIGDHPDMLIVHAHMAMPASWSEKKRQALNGQPCQQKPDFDNLLKSVSDALFAEDATIWLGLVTKHWCSPGNEGLAVRIYYQK